jgi:hypothetical protein
MPPTKRSPGFSKQSQPQAGECEGDHLSTPYEPTFQQAVVEFLERQWGQRRAV